MSIFDEIIDAATENFCSEAMEDLATQHKNIGANYRSLVINRSARQAGYPNGIIHDVVNRNAGKLEFKVDPYYRTTMNSKAREDIRHKRWNEDDEGLLS